MAEGNNKTMAKDEVGASICGAKDWAARPPRERNPNGEERRVGVEIEFAAISARDGATIVQELFGGEIREADPHRFHVEGAEFGDFICELDSKYAHRAEEDEEEGGGLFGEKIGDAMRSLFGSVSAFITPCEIVCPPIAFSQLYRLDQLVKALNRAGAAGTHDNPLYAFGVQLNPEIASDDAAYLAATLKAYLLASDWLRSAIKVDVTRRLTAFANPFPNDYVNRLLLPDCWPDRARLIDDYLYANPTRNRELDMLPLFAWLDESRVRAAVDDDRIKPRPTFHYRLPDANIGDEDWSIGLEWRRWLVVERLAENKELMAKMAFDRACARGNGDLRDWPTMFAQHMILTGT